MTAPFDDSFIRAEKSGSCVYCGGRTIMAEVNYGIYLHRECKGEYDKEIELDLLRRAAEADVTITETD